MTELQKKVWGWMLAEEKEIIQLQSKTSGTPIALLF